ncbi:hypothetical protein DL93DRAFT_2172001 [Clavulina sp. PMI_390]|nr:hypothetical protein DL93DRAFT_2172001 [Clavulina sp. PMI_390]
MATVGCFGGIIDSFKKKPRPQQLPSAPSPAQVSPEKSSKSLFGSGSCSCSMEPPSTSAENWDDLPKYTPTVQNVADDEGLKAIETSIDSLDAELRELSLDIHDHPELGFQEKHAHDVLTKFMSDHGFSVTPHYLGLETAWRATWSQGSGGRTIGFNSEMDALPGIGHACGHNLIAIGGVAGALGVKAALEKTGTPGTVILLGTPAEEGGYGKVHLIERGAYKPMHACLMMHPAPGPKHSFGTGPSRAIQIAHASAAPWEAKNALDAAVLAYSSISVLRQQIKPDHRTHGIIEGKDWAPNVIPDYARLWWIVRAPTAAEVVILGERVTKCFEAAAVATGTEIKITSPKVFGFDLRQNRALAEDFGEVMSRYGMSDLKYEGAVGGSTDFGNVTYELPSLHPAFAIPTVPNGGNHTAAFTNAARNPRAHAITLVMAKGLATSGLRIITDDAFYAKVKKTYDEEFEKK